MLAFMFGLGNERLGVVSLVKLMTQPLVIYVGLITLCFKPKANCPLLD